MFGYEIGEAPKQVTGTSVLARIVDGLAFRYYWATDGLRLEDYTFRPGPESMSTLELQQHILNLVCMIEQTVLNATERETIESDDPAVLREKALEILRLVRERLDELTDDALAGHRVLKRDGTWAPVWNIMNGPLADALTHVGQINAWRRLNGNPTPRANVFAGLPPR
jgi:hypothetical protein